MNLKFLSILSFLFLAVACSDDSPAVPEVPDTPDLPNSVEKLVTINAGQTFQTLAGFGASDCWAPAFVGKN